jgi:hypothetical protein
MGKSSRTKRRSSVRSARRARSGVWWYVLAAVVIVAGVGTILLSRSPSGADTPPIVNKDHWHAAIGVNVCGQWMENAPTFEDAEGIHTHGDGLIHIHPFLTRAAGKKATVGLYFKLGGWKASDDSFTLWDGKTHQTGDKCDGKPAEVRWELNGKPQTGKITDLRPQNGDIIALALLPKGEKIGTPPSASELAAPSDLPGGTPVPSDTTPTTTGAGATPPTSATGTAPTSSP